MRTAIVIVALVAGSLLMSVGAALADTHLDLGTSGMGYPLTFEIGGGSADPNRVYIRCDLCVSVGGALRLLHMGPHEFSAWEVIGLNLAQMYFIAQGGGAMNVAEWRF